MQNSGIYKLEFKDGSYYIGQSVDLSSRYKDHIRYLLNGTHHSYKVQDKYNQTKELPDYKTILFCPIENLNKEEDIRINLADPLCLNIKGGGSSNFGINAPTAKYLTTDIELVFLLLVENPGIKHKDVAKFVGIDINTVHDISAGRNRAATEMRRLYPDKYEKLIKIKAANTRGKYTIVLEHTDGRVVRLLSGEYSEFCRSNNIQTSNLSKVISGTRKTTMGWKLLEKYENF